MEPRIFRTGSWIWVGLDSSALTGDLVLDPFAGAGTVGRACEQLARRWIGVELSANYGALARGSTAQMGLQFKRELRPFASISSKKSH